MKDGIPLNINYSPEAEIFIQLYWVNKMIGTKFDASTGVSQSRMEILSIVFVTGEMSQSDIQKKLDIDRAAITRHVKQLEADGLISRRRSSEDNRIIFVSLTDQGRAQMGSFVEAKDIFMNKVLAKISEQERHTLQNILLQMRENLEQIQS